MEWVLEEVRHVYGDKSDYNTNVTFSKKDREDYCPFFIMIQKIKKSYKKNIHPLLIVLKKEHHLLLLFSDKNTKIEKEEIKNYHLHFVSFDLKNERAVVYEWENCHGVLLLFDEGEK